MAVVNQHFCLVVLAVDRLHIALDLVHGHLVWLFYRIPHAEILSVLCDDHVRVWHPGDVLAVVQQRLLLLFFYVVEVELLAFVTEEKLGAAGVQLEVVDFGIVGNSRLNHILRQVIDADGHHIDQVGNHFGWFAATELLLAVVEASGDHVRVYVLRSAGADDLVDAVLDD